VLHFVVGEEVAQNSVRAFRDAVVPGSYLALAHGTFDEAPLEIAGPMLELGKRATSEFKNRSRVEIRALMDGWELVEPGLVYLPLWRPECPDDLFMNHPQRSLNFVGLGRKL
jgi:hypothetical protein